jgi:hypothetical protein
MSAILYPVAENAERALAGPRGRAAREREAQALAAGPVTFVTEPAGPAFASEEEALAAWAGRIDAAGKPVGPADRYCTLREVMAPVVGRRPKPKQARLVNRDGRRWSEPPPLPQTVWRLSVSYWRIAGAEEKARMERDRLEQARRARRSAAGEGLDAAQLRAMAHQPMRPFRPQQPLDIGLFEFRPPDAPHIVMPDE